MKMETRLKRKSVTIGAKLDFQKYEKSDSEERKDDKDEKLTDKIQNTRRVTAPVKLKRTLSNKDFHSSSTTPPISPISQRLSPSSSGSSFGSSSLEWKHSGSHSSPSSPRSTSPNSSGSQPSPSDESKLEHLRQRKEKRQSLRQQTFRKFRATTQFNSETVNAILRPGSSSPSLFGDRKSSEEITKNGATTPPKSKSREALSSSAGSSSKELRDSSKDHKSSLARFTKPLMEKKKTDTTMATYINDISEQLSSCLQLLDVSRKSNLEKFNPSIPRDKVIKELYTTEITYHESLSLLVKTLFLDNSIPFSKIEFEDIFSNVIPIFKFSSTLLRLFDERFAVWGTESDSVGDLVLQRCPYLKIYRAYCDKYDLSQEALKKACKRKTISSYLEARQKDMNNQTIKSFLILPVQRVPRYMLLLKDIKKKTDPSHVDYRDVCQALENIESIASYLENSLQRAIKMRRFKEVTSTYQGMEMLYYEHSRELIHESDCQVFNLSNSGEVMCDFVFLCSDIIVFVKKISQKYLYHIDLQYCSVVPPKKGQFSAGESNHGTIIRSKVSKPIVDYLIIFENAQKLADFSLLINDTINERVQFVQRESEDLSKN